MAVIIPPDHFQLTVLFSANEWDSGGGAAVLGFRNDGTDPEETAAGTALDLLLNALMPLTTDTVTCTGARWAATVLGGAFVRSVQGGLTSTVSTPNTSMLLRKQTPFRGPRGGGRTYWPQMVSETEVDEAGIIGGTRLAAINSALDDFETDLTTAGLAQVVLQGDTGISDPITPPPTVVEFLCDPKVATQRRRMRR